MSHLSPAEFVDAADRRLRPSRVAHLERCARCRAHAEDVRSALDAAQAVDVPEPSPLYWQHFAAHLRERVARESIEPAWRAGSWSDLIKVRALVPIASALAVVAAVIVAGEMTRPRPLPVPVPVTAVAAVTPADAAVVPENSEVWQVLTSAAGEMPMDETHEAGMGVSGSAIDGAVQRMSPDELAELGRLLQSQLRGSGD
jgi:hypothetical protein